MPTHSASAKTQPRAYMPLTGRRFGSFAGKAVLTPLAFLGRNATREQYALATIESYRPATREQYEPATVEQA